MIDNVLCVKGWKLFLGIVSLNLIIILMSQLTLVNEDVFYNTYSEQLTYEKSIELFQQMQSNSWVSFIVAPFFLLIKFTAISVLLYIGLFFSDLSKSVALSKIFKVVIINESVFIGASLIKLLWFIFFAGNYTLEDMTFFYPMSLINLFKRSEVAAYWVYPLQTVNLFQLLYMILLAIGLTKAGSMDKRTADKIVLTTYVPAITVWVTLIMFLTIDEMP